MQAWILAVRALVRSAVAESRLAAGVFQGDFAEAAFAEVVAKSLQNVAQFGEAIVHGRRSPPPPLFPPTHFSLPQRYGKIEWRHELVLHSCGSACVCD